MRMQQDQVLYVYLWEERGWRDRQLAERRSDQANHYLEVGPINVLQDNSMLTSFNSTLILVS